MKPQDWLAHMEKKLNEFKHAGHEMDDESFLTYVMPSLPQVEYQTTVLTLRAKLSKDKLSIEEAETLLDDKYEAMKEISGWTEEGDELVLVIGKPHLKKTVKGQCCFGSNMGLKQLIVLKERPSKKTTKTRHI